MGKKLVASFAFERETKNTVRFQEIGESPIIGVLYVQKTGLAQLGMSDMPLGVGDVVEVAVGLKRKA